MCHCVFLVESDCIILTTNDGLRKLLVKLAYIVILYMYCILPIKVVLDTSQNRNMD